MQNRPNWIKKTNTMDPWCTHQALSKVVNLHIVLHHALGILDAGCANHHVQEWG